MCQRRSLCCSLLAAPRRRSRQRPSVPCRRGRPHLRAAWAVRRATPRCPAAAAAAAVAAARCPPRCWLLDVCILSQCSVIGGRAGGPTGSWSRRPGRAGRSARARAEPRRSEEDVLSVLYIYSVLRIRMTSRLDASRHERASFLWTAHGASRCDRFGCVGVGGGGGNGRGLDVVVNVRAGSELTRSGALVCAGCGGAAAA